MRHTSRQSRACARKALELTGVNGSIWADCRRRRHRIDWLFPNLRRRRKSLGPQVSQDNQPHPSAAAWARSVVRQHRYAARSCRSCRYLQDAVPARIRDQELVAELREVEQVRDRVLARNVAAPVRVVVQFPLEDISDLRNVAIPYPTERRRGTGAVLGTALLSADNRRSTRGGPSGSRPLHARYRRDELRVAVIRVQLDRPFRAGDEQVIARPGVHAEYRPWEFLYRLPARTVRAGDGRRKR